MKKLNVGAMNRSQEIIVRKAIVAIGVEKREANAMRKVIVYVRSHTLASGEDLCLSVPCFFLRVYLCTYYEFHVPT
jgi:hypothetical protein